MWLPTPFVPSGMWSTWKVSVGPSRCFAYRTDCVPNAGALQIWQTHTSPQKCILDRTRENFYGFKFYLTPSIQSPTNDVRNFWFHVGRRTLVGHHLRDSLSVFYTTDENSSSSLSQKVMDRNVTIRFLSTVGTEHITGLVFESITCQYKTILPSLLTKH